MVVMTAEMTMAVTTATKGNPKAQEKETNDANANARATALVLPNRAGSSVAVAAGGCFELEQKKVGAS